MPTFTIAPCCPTEGDIHYGHQRPADVVSVTFTADHDEMPGPRAVAESVRGLVSAVLADQHDRTRHDWDTMPGWFVHDPEDLTVRVETETGSYLDHDCDGAWTETYRSATVTVYVDRVAPDALDEAIRRRAATGFGPGRAWLDGWNVEVVR